MHQVFYRIMKLTSFLCLAGICLFPAGSQTNRDMDFMIANLEEAGYPFIFGDYIVLSYKPDEPTRYIGARFSHENFKFLYTYIRNDHNVFFLLYPIPLDQDIIRYRIVVDGIWMEDPFNFNVYKDAMGIPFSVIMLEGEFEKPVVNPVIVSERTVSFRLEEIPGESVFIAGDFNNWDPFFHPLKKEGDGLWHITLTLLPGRHYYYFISGATKFIDPYNPDVMLNEDDLPVSTFILPQ